MSIRGVHWWGVLTEHSLPVQSPRGRAVTWLRSSQTSLLLLALLVGAGAGAGAVVFRWLITEFTKILSGHADYSNAGHAINPFVPGLGEYFVIAAPVVAGLLYGPMVYFFAREARGHGVPEVMYAVARRGGRIGPKVAVVKALASALCIGGGGSVGREGPIVQIGSALGSTLGMLAKVAEPRIRVLVACGAAGGIAATFNAPLAGVFFAMELILANFAAQSFGMVVLASVTASVIGRSAFGGTPFLQLPQFHVQHFEEYFLFAFLGLVAGPVGVMFTKVLYWVEDACDTLWKGPEWARPAVGGVLLGLLLLALPQMYGVGYPVLGNGVAGKYAVGFLLLLLVGKMVATSLTIGIGGSGGVFAPSLFIGAMLGGVFGQVLHQLAPGMAGPAGAYGLIGMGAVFAGAARAPITAVVIMFELTGDYAIILPLMAAIVLATGVAHAMTKDTIYTLKLRRRGIDLNEQPVAVRAATLKVADIMQQVPPTVPEDMTLMDAAQRLSASSYPVLPVVDSEGAYLGTITARAVTEVLSDGKHDDAVVSSAVELPRELRASSSLNDAIPVLDDSEGSAVPVLDLEGKRLVGWLTPQAALGALRGDKPHQP